MSRYLLAYNIANCFFPYDMIGPHLLLKQSKETYFARNRYIDLTGSMSTVRYLSLSLSLLALVSLKLYKLFTRIVQFILATGNDVHISL